MLISPKSLRRSTAAGSTWVSSAACLPAAMASSIVASWSCRDVRLGRLSEALPFAAVCRNALRHLVRRVDQVVLGEPLGQLAALRVPQPDPVADAESVRRRAGHRGLHFPRAL